MKFALSDVDVQTPSLDLVLIALDEALDRMSKLDERLVTIVELRYFAGLSVEAAAEPMKVSRATAATRLEYGRSWRHRELTR